MAHQLRQLGHIMKWNIVHNRQSVMSVVVVLSLVHGMGWELHHDAVVVIVVTVIAHSNAPGMLGGNLPKQTLQLLLCW